MSGKSPVVGIDHPTVVPTNFDADDGDASTTETTATGDTAP